MSKNQTILVLCIILYSVHQASSLKCYVCSSKFDGPCYTNPKKEEFQKECSLGNNVKSTSTLPEIANSTLLVKRPNISATNNELSTTADSMECYEATGNGPEGKLVVRDCIDKSYTNDYIIQLASMDNATTESIYCCNTDLCNSSSNLSINLSSLIISTLFIFSIKL